MKNRIKAFLIHASLSFTVAIGALLIVFLFWYPAPLHKVMGVTQLFFILLAVDVILGPVITFIIYKPKKKNLVLDLSIIVLVQLIALSYGMYTIYQGRPAYVVFSKDRFETVRPFDIDSESLKIAQNNNNKLASSSWFKPQWIAVEASSDIERRQEILLSSALGGADWPYLPELYIPLVKVKTQVIEKAKSLNKLLLLHDNNSEVNEKIKKYSEKNVKWLPLLGVAKNMTILINANSGAVIEVVDIDPWP